jgi:UDP-glucose 6-dehydrogenase
MTDGLPMTVFGTGYLGITHAAGMASVGFEVLGVDTDAGAKAAANAVLATKVPFIYAIAEICEISGADARTLSVIPGSDPRIGEPLLRANRGSPHFLGPKLTDTRQAPERPANGLEAE